LKGNKVSIEEMRELHNVISIDVRSPSEYKEGTIPGAINIPLFEDEERTKVGTVYKQICTERAKDLGYKIVEPKLPHILEQIKSASQNVDDNIILFCWRGGMRSQSLKDYCNEMGLKVVYLSGGYKAYRRLVHSFLSDITNIPEMVVLNGLTGVGKTDLLSLLSERKIPTIDIEKIANNRGSVFGQIHGGNQPSQKAFEAEIFENVCNNQLNYSVIECESKRIGKLYIPDSVFQKMKTGKQIHLYASLKTRVDRLIVDYATFPEERLIDAILHLKKALGRNKMNNLIDLVNEKRFDEVATILLKDYYDPLYGYPTGKVADYDLSVNCDNLNHAAEEIIDYLK